MGLHRTAGNRKEPGRDMWPPMSGFMWEEDCRLGVEEWVVGFMTTELPVHTKGQGRQRFEFWNHRRRGPWAGSKPTEGPLCFLLCW